MSDAGSRSVRVGWCVSCCCLWVAHVLIVVKGVLTSHMASSPRAVTGDTGLFPEILGPGSRCGLKG